MDHSLRRSRHGAALMLVMILGGCGNPAGSPTSAPYTILWKFINNSCSSALFVGTDEYAGINAIAGVPASGTANESTEGELEIGAPEAIDLLVRVGPLGGTNPGASAQRLVGAFETVTATAVWDGTRITLSASTNASPAPTASANVESCPAPEGATWTLTGITAPASWNHSDASMTASGTLTLNVPSEIREGQTYSVSAIFSATITSKPGGEGFPNPISASLTDPVAGGGTGNVAIGSFALGAANPTNSGAVTAAGSWTLGAVHHDGPTLTLIAQGNLRGISRGIWTATYTKVP